MTQTYQTSFKTVLAANLAVADTTATLATPPTVTKGRMLLKNGNIQEWISFTGVSGNTITGLTRGLSQTADPATGGTGLAWGAGTQIILVAMHDQLPDKLEPTAFTQAITTPDISFTGTTTAGLKVKSLTTAQRDAISNAANGDIIYNTTTGVMNQYIGGAWTDFATGTIANATTSVAGKVQTDVAPAGTPTALITDNPKYDALAGTSGTPSSSNKYVTNDDTATAATADKVARRLAGGNITVVTESPGNNTTNAASTAFVTAGLLAIASAFDTLTFTRDISTASGTQVINHNLGKTPKNITFSCLGALNIDAGIILRQCFGGYDGITNNCVTTDIGAGLDGASNTYSIAFQDTNYSKAYVGSITAWDSTTFTITWTKTGTPDGTINIFATLIA